MKKEVRRKAKIYKCKHGQRFVGMVTYCEQCLIEVEQEHGTPFWEQDGGKPVYGTPNKYTPLGADALDYVEARKKAYGSTKKYIEGKGMTFDVHLFEDCFQEAIYQVWRNQKSIMETSIKQEIPIDGLISRKTRQRYIDYLRKWSKREDLTVSVLTEEYEKDKKTVNVTYRAGNIPSPETVYIEQEQDNELFSRLTGKQKRIAKLLLAGAKKQEIAKRLNVSRQTVYNELQGLKYELTSQGK